MNQEEFDCFARRIRELRTHRHLTQEALAQELGLSRQSIYSIETGRCLPSLNIAIDLIKFFDQTFDDFFMENNIDDDFETEGDTPTINISENDEKAFVSIPLPLNIDAEKIKAEIKDGILNIEIPKKSPAETKSTQIKIEKK